jgi:hypothetical protein
MGIVPTPVFLQEFAVRFAGGAVQIRWRLGDSSDPAEFRLQARQGAREWTVPHTPLDAREFTATDDSPELTLGGTVTYSLYSRESGSGWVWLGQESLALSKAPGAAHLLASRPNPFNPRVTIPYVLGTRQQVRLGVYDLDGRRVALLLDAVRPPGSGAAVWDGTDGAGRPAASGLYLVRLEAGGSQTSRRLVLIR